MAGNYKDSNVFIHDQNGAVLRQTAILEHDREAMIITIDGLRDLPDSKEAVTVLIVQQDGVHEYMGHVRRSFGRALTYEIALFKGQIKEERKSKRFNVNAKARVPNLIFDRVSTPLLNPLPVTIVNLSSSGALIRTSTNSFARNTYIEMSLDIGGQRTSLYGKVVRINDFDSEITDYGCKFIDIKSD